MMVEGLIKQMATLVTRVLYSQDKFTNTYSKSLSVFMITVIFWSRIDLKGPCSSSQVSKIKVCINF